MGLSVVIPSRTESNALACIKAIQECEIRERVNIIIVDDGMDWCGESTDWMDVIGNWVSLAIDGTKPFIFSRNCNKGIEAAEAMRPGDDVILLNDDALLKTDFGFTAMQRAAQRNPEYGIISATTNLAGNPDQHPMGIGLRDAGEKSVAFVCVLIPRRTIERVGLLDERFTAYGWEDNDYCRRVREAGLKVGIFDGCYVDHASLKSTFRGDPHAAGDIGAGAEIYRAKWGNLA